MAAHSGKWVVPFFAGWLVTLPVANAFSPARQFPDTWDRISVFVDQLPLLTHAQSEFAATHYVGTQKQVFSGINKIRQYNPDFLHLQYRLAYGVSEAQFVHNGVWSSDLEVVNGNEDWFLRDSQGNRVFMDIGAVPIYVMDTFNSEWENYYVDTVSHDVTVTSADGIFADVAILPAAVPNGFWDSPLGAPPHTNYIGRLETWYDTMFDRFDSRDIYFIPNIGGLQTTLDHTSGYFEDVHGAMVEGFSRLNASGSLDWRLQLNRVLRLVNNDKIFIAQEYLQAEDIEERMWLLSNFLLVKRDRSYLNIVAGGIEQIHWWPEYDIDLGAPISDVKVADILQLDPDGDGIYTREFNNGVVLVNGTGSPQSVDVDPRLLHVLPSGGGRILADGTEQNPGQLIYTVIDGSISIPAFNGVVLIFGPEVTGDYNGDGVVNAADYTVWRDTLGSTSDLRADGDADRVVGEEDYATWKSAFTQGGSNIHPASAVPESTSAVMYSLAIVALTFRHRFLCPRIRCTISG